ncbi:MAG: hypothetical protein IJ501_03695 [Bacilli bacterium]|nr:hypothetical protein [Bacilli bacterium]
MNNQNKKYYEVKLRNFSAEKVDYTKPFADLDSENSIKVYAEGNENNLVEILTGTKIQFGVLLEGILPGISKREIPVSEVSKYLKFLTDDGKRKELAKIQNCLEVTKDEIIRQERDFQIASETFQEEIQKGRK